MKSRLSVLFGIAIGIAISGDWGGGGMSGVDAFISGVRPRFTNVLLADKKGYPISQRYYEESLKRLNNRELREMREIGMMEGDSIIIIRRREYSTNNDTILDDVDDDDGDDGDDMDDDGDDMDGNDSQDGEVDLRDRRIHQEHREINRRNHAIQKMMERYENNQVGSRGGMGGKGGKGSKTENFEVVYNGSITFADIGGFDSIKSEMLQCVDMLQNWETYARFSVRTPKGLVLEGPPGNGKTMLARAFASEAGVAFIPVSGAEFQDKYIGVGSSKVRELFNLAIDNRPCIIFIDEIDALGRRRSDSGESGGGGAERDNTLNQLLVEMDGFRNNTGIFVIGATNRADLLDPALMRPGRIDKRIYVGMPDVVARRFIVDIHIKGKPNTLGREGVGELVSMTGGFSGAQIENLLNEAMIFALKSKREVFHRSDIDVIYNRMISGTQSEAHIISDDMLERICVHEMGHSLMGLFCKHHPLMKKVVINMMSPKNPGMTIFEDDGDGNMLSTRDALVERIGILYGGQIAEKLIYGEGMVSSGAISDYEEARKVAQRMVLEFGMGGRYSGIGEKSKEKIDEEIEKLLCGGYDYAYSVLQSKRDCIVSGSAILKRDMSVTRKDLLAYLML